MRNGISREEQIDLEYKRKKVREGEEEKKEEDEEADKWAINYLLLAGLRLAFVQKSDSLKGLNRSSLTVA